MALSRSAGFALLATAIADYDESRATLYVKLAGAAYCPRESLESWSCGDYCNDVPVSSVKVCQGTATQAFVGMWEEKGLVSFEGSSNIKSWLRNIDFVQTEAPWEECEECWVHEGFLQEYQTLEDCIKASLEAIGAPSGSTIRTTGHSLGAALNTIAMLDLDYAGWIIEESYDFGKPRTGNSAFAQAWDSKFSSIAFRVTHHQDPVPQLPADDILGLHPDWEHTQPEMFYDGDVSNGYEECNEPHQTTCCEQYWNIPFHVLFQNSVDDHLQYLDLRISDCPNDGTATNVPQDDPDSPEGGDAPAPSPEDGGDAAYPPEDGGDAPAPPEDGGDAAYPPEDGGDATYPPEDGDDASASPEDADDGSEVPAPAPAAALVV